MSFKRGALIVLEGIDNVGKTTQCKMLVNSLRKRQIKAKFISFPNRQSCIGKVIDEYLNSNCKLDDHTIHLLFSANRWEKFEEMKQMMMEGCTLIVDRYSYSGIAFSSAKEGMDMDWCKSPEIGLIKPDLVYFLAINPASAAQRGDYGNERYESEGVQNAVAKKFDKLINLRDNWQIIDGSNDIEDIHTILVESTVKKLKDVEYTNLQYLSF